jgi:hypothetical protein
MSDLLAEDHLTLLALAKAAIAAEQGPLWKTDVEAAADVHGAACNAVWDELRRQIDISEGRIPVIEHPGRKQLALARRMRAEILTTVQCAVEDAIASLERGGCP